jgi:hypothetical protein
VNNSIVNPARFFVNGHDEVEFTYEGGRNLYFFSPCDNGLTDSTERELIFFADSEGHALDVLRRLFKFALRANARFERYIKRTDGRDGTASLREASIRDFTSYLRALKAGQIKVSRAPRTQVYAYDNSDIG